MAGRSDIAAGKAFVEVYVKNSALVKGLNAVKARLQGLGSSVMRIGGLLTGMGAAILAPLVGIVSHFSALGSELADMSARTGQSVGSLAELKFAAEQTGASLGDVETAIKMQQKKGITQSFDQIAASIAAIEDPAERTQAAMEAWGKSGTKLIPMLKDLQDLRQEARDLGLVPTEQAVSAADEIGDSFDKIKSVVSATLFELGAALAPVLMPVLETTKNIAGWFNRWARENGGVIRTVAMVGVGLVAAGAIVTAIGAGIFALGTAAGLAATAIGAIGSVVALILNPWTLVVAAIVGAAFAWARFTESGRASVQTVIDFFAPLLETARTAIAGIGDALIAGDLTLAGKIAVTALQLLLQAINQIAGMIGGTLGAVLKTVGLDLIEGDLAGVWDTVVKGMTAAWDAFGLGVITMFKTVVDQVGQLWKGATDGMVGGIALLEAAALALGDKVGAAALGKLRRGVQAVSTIGSGAIGVASAATGAGVAAQQQTAIRSGFDFQTKIDRASGQSDAKVTALTAELAALREQAARAREEAGLRRPDLAAPDVAGVRGESTVTFSGAGLLAAGMGGGTPLERIAKEQDKKLGKLIELSERLLVKKPAGVLA